MRAVAHRISIFYECASLDLFSGTPYRDSSFLLPEALLPPSHDPGI